METGSHASSLFANGGCDEVISCTARGGDGTSEDDIHDKEKRFPRHTAPYDAEPSRRWRLGKRTFDKQYSHIYYTRLNDLRMILRDVVQGHWGCSSRGVCLVEHILRLEEGVRSVVIGTLYKEMALKPSVLDEFAKERTRVKDRLSSFVSDSDTLVLEDETGRCRLTAATGEGTDSMLDVECLATGVVVALLGTLQSGGDFAVEDLCFPDLPVQPPFPAREDDCYVALLSGLVYGQPENNPVALQLLADYLSGHLGSDREQEFESRIVRVIIAGNSVTAFDPEHMEGFQLLHAPGTRQPIELTGPIRELDLLLTQVAASVPVDLMPGGTDPTNFALPQQPMQPCLLPSVGQYATFSSTTNPFECSIGGVRFLGTSGQPIDDLLRVVKSDSILDVMESTLRWRHLSPTAPDTLACYPFHDQDPFIIHTCPHVYFVGNQSAYMTRTVEGRQGQQIRLLSLPSFAQSGTIVLVNLRTLNCHPMSFGCSLARDTPM